MAASRRLWQFATMQTTDDGFLGGKLRILQPKKGFRAGVDSVFLAASVPARAGDKVVEAGTGPGVAALCLLARVPGIHLTGIEREAPSAALARENAARNGLMLDVIEADIT
ncbi:MAG: methyltransferase, partial [Aestuariivirgaceae bacterium]|nr:methyltransferase [Aestuariivirgaceae bacterium]